MKKYLIALDRRAKDWCCRTVLVSAENENEAYSIAKRLRPNDELGMIKEVSY